jgi:parallel beta-helix repeat protein
VPVLREKPFDRVVELRGDSKNPVSHVRIEDFTITDTRFTAPERLKDTYHADDAAIWLWGASHCRIAENTFRDVGGYGVMLRDNESSLPLTAYFD